MAALKYHTFVAIYDTQPDGDNVVASRSIEVRDKNTGIYATIYSDSAGASPITQPGAATDANGVFEFYVAPGLYTITDGVRTETVDLKPHSYTFDTVAAAKAAQYLEVGDTVKTREYSAGNGGGASYKVVGPATGADDGKKFHDMSNGNQLQKLNASSITLNIPTDYSTIQDAIDNTSTAAFMNTAEIIINIESGHSLTAGVNVRQHNYSRYRITSVDATVPLDAGFVGADTTGVDAGLLGDAPAAPFMLVAHGAVSPVLDCKIDMGNGFGTGVQVAGGHAIITSGNGVINAGYRGIQVHGRADAYGSVWDGAAGTGIRLQQASNGNFRSATANNCCSTDDLTSAAVYASRSSTLEFRGGSAQNSGASGLIARRAVVTMDEANVDGAADKGVEAENCSQVSFANGSALNCVSNAMRSIANANLYAVGTTSSTTTSADNLNVDIGGVITVAASNTIEGVAGSEAQVIAESNVAYTNSFDTAGMIFFDSGNGAFKITSNANGISQRFADGRMLTFINTSVDTGTVASGAFSSQLTMPTQPDTFVSIDGSSMNIIGRTAVSGGGSRVCVDNYYRPTVLTGTAWRVFNTGQQLDGASTGLSIESVNLSMVTYGAWR